MRLNKALAAAGAASRRKADELIKQGAVRVNGQVVDTPGVTINPLQDRLEVHGKPVTVATETEEHVYLAMNKPPKVMTTLSDPQGRRTILDILPQEYAHRRVFPVGRLDFMSEGLLLLTTDGDLAHGLSHPSRHLPKTYHVNVRADVTEEMLQTMRDGMTLPPESGRREAKLAPIEAKIVHRRGDKTLLELVLIQGVNRQIRRICKALGLGIVWLQRVAHGPVRLGELPPGAVRPLNKKELVALQKAVQSA